MVTQVGPNVLNAEESSLSSWAGPYVTEMLGRGQALAGMPYQAYMGPLTAGQSTLQDTAFQGLAGLNIPTAQQTTYDPMSFTGAGTLHLLHNKQRQVKWGRILRLRVMSCNST
jgi:hypothetical protein